MLWWQQMKPSQTVGPASCDSGFNKDSTALSPRERWSCPALQKKFTRKSRTTNVNLYSAWDLKRSELGLCAAKWNTWWNKKKKNYYIEKDTKTERNINRHTDRSGDTERDRDINKHHRNKMQLPRVRAVATAPTFYHHAYLPKSRTLATSVFESCFRWLDQSL